jgi:hypothetical protein
MSLVSGRPSKEVLENGAKRRNVYCRSAEIFCNVASSASARIGTRLLCVSVMRRTPSPPSHHAKRGKGLESNIPTAAVQRTLSVVIPREHSRVDNQLTNSGLFTRKTQTQSSAALWWTTADSPERFPASFPLRKFAENLCAGGDPAAVHGESYVRGHAEGSGIKIVSRTETGTRH